MWTLLSNTLLTMLRHFQLAIEQWLGKRTKIVTKPPYLQAPRLAYHIVQISYVRASTIVKLNSYIAILTSQKYKKYSTIMKVYLNILPFELQYASIFGCILQLEAKQKKCFFIPTSIKIIFLLFLYLILFLFLFFLLFITQTQMHNSFSSSQQSRPQTQDIQAIAQGPYQIKAPNFGAKFVIYIFF